MDPEKIGFTVQPLISCGSAGLPILSGCIHPPSPSLFKVKSIARRK
jgi:hypothetical protein